MTTPDPDFTPSNAQNGYGKHLASSLPPTLFPILVFALERGGLRIPTPQLTEALDLGNLVVDNLDPEKGIGHEVIALLECIERYSTHTARSRDAEIGDLQNQIANLQAQLFTSTKKNAEYAERLLDAHATPSVRISRRTTKDPDPFDASEKDTAKRQEQYTDWRTAIVRTFTIDEEHFATEFRKIQHIAGLLKGDAYRLFEPQLHLYNEHPHDPELWHWKTYTSLLHDLNLQYETHDLTRAAAIEFDNWKMRGKSYPNFIARFITLAAKCGKTAEQKVEALRQRVSDELANEVTHRPNKPARGDFEAWSKLYGAIYDDLQDEKHINQLRKNAGMATTRPHGFQNMQIVQNTTPATANDDPMQLDSRNQHYNSSPQSPRPQPQPRLRSYQTQNISPNANASKEKIRAHRRTNNLCFYCGDANHQVQNCPAKQQNDNRWSKPNPDPQERRQQTAPPRFWCPQPQQPQYQYSPQHLRQIENREGTPSITSTESPVTSYTPTIDTNQGNA
jgi:hypothetical protein